MTSARFELYAVLVAAFFSGIAVGSALFSSPVPPDPIPFNPVRYSCVWLTSGLKCAFSVPPQKEMEP